MSVPDIKYLGLVCTKIKSGFKKYIILLMAKTCRNYLFSDIPVAILHVCFQYILIKLNVN